MPRIIAVMSGKGGVGKTTSAINLGVALNKFGKDVVVVDANLTTPNVGLHLGAPIVPISLYDVLAKRNNISEAVYEHHSGTKIVPTSLSLQELNEASFENLSGAMKKLKKMTDIVICDGAAGLGYEALSAIDACDEVVIITQAELPAVADALKTVKIAEQMGKKIAGVIVTRVDKSSDEMSIKSIESMLEHKVLGIVPDDNAIGSALAARDAVVNSHPRSRASRSYKKIAAKLIGQEYNEGFFSRVAGFFGAR
jgi:septum site-determining protein MinD